MKIPFTENLLQALLIAFNFIFALLGVSLIALGVVYTDDLLLVNIYVTRIEFLKLPTALIILGSTSFLSSLIGCYIVRKCHQKLIIIYIGFLCLLLAVELTIGILAFRNAWEPTSIVTKEMTHMLHTDNQTRDNFYILEQHQIDNYSTAFPKSGECVNEMSQLLMFCSEQSKFSCCGINSVNDYKNDELILHNNSICYRIFYSPGMKELPGCAFAVEENIQRISFEVGGSMVVYSILQFIDIACLVMILFQLRYTSEPPTTTQIRQINVDKNVNINLKMEIH